MALIHKIIPSWKSLLLALLSAVLLALSFPDFDLWFLAWIAFVPLIIAIYRESPSPVRPALVGWVFGTAFFFATCWWLTFAPINYAGFPPWLAYSGMAIIAATVGLFPAVFAAILGFFLRKFGSWGIWLAPSAWVSAEFIRYWLTGNNWNAVGYSQAFHPRILSAFWADAAGVHSVTFAIILVATLFALLVLSRDKSFVRPVISQAFRDKHRTALIVAYLAFTSGLILFRLATRPDRNYGEQSAIASVVAIQPNVPMSGLDARKLEELGERQFSAAEAQVKTLRNPDVAGDKPISQSSPQTQHPTLVVLPESPMNFMYEDDREFQKFINGYARRNNVSVLFNSAEPDATNGKYFNSAVMVGPQGSETAQYDKIYLLPFGEAVPTPLEGVLPGFVGNFSYGREYDLLPVGDAKAGVMICFESHFGQLSRKYVQDGADVIIEMTNDGYLGPTPVLRQHLANAVFRAVETNRPLLRVTNVGITAYITVQGQILDPAPTYQEATRIWPITKSAGDQTLYVRFGDWFAWLCVIVTAGLISVSLFKRNDGGQASASST